MPAFEFAKLNFQNSNQRKIQPETQTTLPSTMGTHIAKWQQIETYNLQPAISRHPIGPSGRCGTTLWEHGSRNLLRFHVCTTRFGTKG